VDWEAVYATQWSDTPDDMDRQRRKQAEFLVHRACAWEPILTISVLNAPIQSRVHAILATFDTALHRPVMIQPEWYY